MSKETTVECSCIVCRKYFPFEMFAEGVAKLIPIFVYKIRLYRKFVNVLHRVPVKQIDNFIF